MSVLNKNKFAAAVVTLSLAIAPMTYSSVSSADALSDAHVRIDPRDYASFLGNMTYAAFNIPNSAATDAMLIERKILRDQEYSVDDAISIGVAAYADKVAPADAAARDQLTKTLNEANRLYSTYNLSVPLIVQLLVNPVPTTSPTTAPQSIDFSPAYQSFNFDQPGVSDSAFSTNDLSGDAGGSDAERRALEKFLQDPIPGLVLE